MRRAGGLPLGEVLREGASDASAAPGRVVVTAGQAGQGTEGADGEMARLAGTGADRRRVDLDRVGRPLIFYFFSSRA